MRSPLESPGPVLDRSSPGDGRAELPGHATALAVADGSATPAAPDGEPREGWLGRWSMALGLVVAGLLALAVADQFGVSGVLFGTAMVLLGISSLRGEHDGEDDDRPRRGFAAAGDFVTRGAGIAGMVVLNTAIYDALFSGTPVWLMVATAAFMLFVGNRPSGEVLAAVKDALGIRTAPRELPRKVEDDSAQ